MDFGAEEGCCFGVVGLSLGVLGGFGWIFGGGSVVLLVVGGVGEGS